MYDINHDINVLDHDIIVHIISMISCRTAELEGHGKLAPSYLSLDQAGASLQGAHEVCGTESCTLSM